MVWRPRVLAFVFPVRLAQWLGPLVVVGVIAALSGLALASLGWLDLTASTPHPAGWADFLHFTFRRSVASHARAVERADDIPHAIHGDRLVRKGALMYAQECSHCHGGPGLGQNPVALSMRPTPQYLWARGDAYSPAELFWIVKHGVKYSAMPAWPAQGRDDEVWALAAFVERLPTLSPAGYRAMTAPPADPLPPTGTAAPDAGVRHRYVMNNVDNSGDAGGKLTPVVPFGAPVGSPPLARCATCHGIDGQGRAGTGVPNIALLPRAYIKAQLAAFASGGRPSGYMQQVAATLTDAQIEQLATYYAAQPKARTTAPTTDAAALARGEVLIGNGSKATGIAACASCHGQEGAAAVGFSRLGGQHPAYLRDQLRLYRQGLRGNGPRDAMVGVARRMSDVDIVAVALAYAARVPGRGQ